jgi:AcrR family transcriptional regulator
MGEPTRKGRQAESTRASLVAVARELFGQKGFAGTSIEEILRRVGVSRGALYHHFGSKEELFRAVYEAVESDLAERVMAAAVAGADAFEELHLGVDAFLDACLDPEVQRIVLLEGPSVLGWETWHEIDERYGFGLIREGVAHAMEAGLIDPQPPDAVAHALLGAVVQAGMVVARAPQPDAARRDMSVSIGRLLDGLRRPAPRQRRG